MSSDIKTLKAEHSETIYKYFFPEWEGPGKNVKCFSGKHEDNNPSLSIFWKDGEFKHHCHACGVSGDCLDLIGSLENIPDTGHQIGRLKEIAGISRKAEPQRKQHSLSLADIQKMVIIKDNRKYKFDRYHTYKAGNPPYIKALFKDSAGDKTGLFYTVADNGRYVSKRKSKPVLYNQEMLSQEGPICFPEGEKDCNTLSEMGLIAITNGSAGDPLTPGILEPLRGRDILIFQDNDIPGRGAAKKKSKALHGIAASVKVIELPGLPEKGDVSDWIQARQAEGKTAEGIKAELRAIVTACPEWQEPETASNIKVEGKQQDSPYFIDDSGNLCKWKQTRDGDIDERLCNFDARISREVLLDDGKTIEQFFEISGKRGNTSLRPVQIRTKDFQNMNWIIENWGNQAVIEVGQAKKDFIRHYIQTQSGNVQRQVIYCHTGWREINSKWVYLSGNGAIGGGPDVCVDLSRKHLAEKYALPLIPENETAAIRASLSLLDIADRRLTIPLYSLVFLSAVTTLLKPMPMFSGGYLYGHTGIRKTTLACLFNSHFGDITAERLMNFESTANSIIEKMSCLKDCLMILDDYRPTHDRADAMKMESIAQRAIRLSGNRATRERLNSDSTMKQSSEPKGMILITGEELVKLPSTLARTMVLEISKGDINLDLLTELQARAAILPHAMTSFILWVKENMQEIRDGFYPQFVQLRAKATANNLHGKLIEQVAYLYYAMTLITSWASEKGILSASQAKDLQTETWAVLNEQVKRQSHIMEHGDPVTGFFEMLNTWIEQGKIRLDDKDGFPDRFVGGDKGEFLGYYDELHFYLLPTALWNYLQRYCLAQGEHFPFTRLTFYKMLKDRRLIETDKDHNTKTERIKGKLQKVLKTLRQGIYTEKAVTTVTEGANAGQ